MKRIVVPMLLLAISALAQPQSQPQQAIDYRFDDVRWSVVVNHAGKEQSASKGFQATSGDTVSTGWFAYALIGSERHRAHFELFSSTRVTLASGTPGAILTLERGRIRAAFDKIVGSEPRTVQTPGALLAVRGTQFDVEVDRSGNTTLDVFEGVVEVQSPLQPQPIFVRAGEESLFGPRRPPMMQPMPEQRRQRGPEGQRGGDNRKADRNGNGDHQPPAQGNHPPGDRPPATGGDRGHGGSQPAPPPPPRKPPVS
jgi:hypothetical protein